MPSTWRRFFLIQVPVALAIFLIAGQGLSVALRGVPLRRSYMDNLAVAVERDRTQHRIVLLGDSITMNATRRFQLGRGPNDVANLATIAWTGAAAELFLLDRYLKTHPAPQYVVYAAAPDDLNNGDSPKLIHYYDWNVYTHPDERAFMRNYVPGIDAGDRLPAIFNVQENILERLTSMASRSPAALTEGSAPPDAHVTAKASIESRADPRIQREREQMPLTIGTLQAAVFRGICQLGQRYGFQLQIVWPPVPVRLLQSWRQDGKLAAMDRRLSDTLGSDCDYGPFFDINSVRAYSDFNRDGFHLHGPQWEERYAADLSQYLAALPDHLPPAPSSKASIATEVDAGAHR